MAQKVNDIIYNTVWEANRKLTPGEVEVSVARETGADRRTVRRAIKDLVSQGDLAYTYVYGTSFLEPSFDRPVRVSKRIVIKPPEKGYQPRPGEVVIDLGAGAAFGNGAHPTTCLALRAIDLILGDPYYLKGKSPLQGLDLGTGTGILAIAMAKLGVQQMVGLDIDPCAISEASHNVALNRLAGQVTIMDLPLEALHSFFSVIVANLASPTLMKLSSLLSNKMEQEGLLVMSGFKTPAAENLIRAFARQGFGLVMKDIERGWVCLALCKTGPHEQGGASVDNP
jgi:ribosomal protein L11 methyltransferase